MFENPIQRAQDQYDADFALGGEVEFEEQGDDEEVDLDLLAARVQAARLAGA